MSKLRKFSRCTFDWDMGTMAVYSPFCLK